MTDIEPRELMILAVAFSLVALLTILADNPNERTAVSGATLVIGLLALAHLLPGVETDD